MVEMNLTISLADISQLELMSKTMTISQMAAEVFGGAGSAEVEEMSAICGRNGIVPRVRKPEVVTLDGVARKSSHARVGERSALPKAPMLDDPISRPAVGRSTVAAEEAWPLPSSAEILETGKTVSADEVMRSAQAAPLLYRMRNAAGEFLNKRKTGLTDDVRFAWVGSAKDVEHLLFMECRSSALTAEPVL